MRVHEVMTHGPECTRPDATIREAAVRMQVLNIGALPVCQDDRLVGIITDRDLTVRTTAAGVDPNRAQVRDVMTPEVVFCFEDQHVAEAASLMKEKQIRRLPVLNRDKRMVGIVALGDLAVETQDDQLAGSTLEAISEPAMSNR